jgi:hypothetical protein
LDLLATRSWHFLNEDLFLSVNLGPPKDYLQDLITLGAWDNEQVAKPLSFLDRITATRRLFLDHFPGGKAEYDVLKKTGDKTAFKKTIIATWGMEGGQANKWRDIVRVAQSTWDYFVQIVSGTSTFRNCFYIFLLLGEYVETRAGKKGKQKAGVKAQKKSGEPLLAPFLGLPTDLLDPLLSEIVKGNVTLQYGHQAAYAMKAEVRMADFVNTIFEEFANEDEEEGSAPKYEELLADPVKQSLLAQFKSKSQDFSVYFIILLDTWLKFFKTAKPQLSTGYLKDFKKDLRALLQKPLHNKPLLLDVPHASAERFISAFKPTIFQGDAHVYC